MGSVMIEFGHRLVLQARRKKADTAWLASMAIRNAHLRGLCANNHWLNLCN